MSSSKNLREKRWPVLYFGNDWFAENRTSSHHIARFLAKQYDIYYVECPGLRPPRTSGRDVTKIWTKLARFLRGARQVEEGIKVWVLLQIPLHRFTLVRWLNRFILWASVRWLMGREKIQRPICWYLLPHVSCLTGRLDERLTIYYCTDDHSALPGVNPTRIRAMDEEITRKADVVFVASETLFPAKLRLNPNTYVSPHGVDFEHFACAESEHVKTPPDAARLPRPVVGFFGLVERWIDLELIDYLAEQRPEWTFLLIGRVAVPDHYLPRRRNVLFLGMRPYDQLPAYAGTFDAAILPYRLTRQVWHANPLKLREYLATGRPVISVRTPEIERYADVVSMADTCEEFLARLDAVLSRRSTQAEIRRRMNRVRAESWQARLTRVLEIVGRHSAGSGDSDEPLRFRKAS